MWVVEYWKVNKKIIMLSETEDLTNKPPVLPVTTGWSGGNTHTQKNGPPPKPFIIFS